MEEENKPNTNDIKQSSDELKKVQDYEMGAAEETQPPTPEAPTAPAESEQPVINKYTDDIKKPEPQAPAKELNPSGPAPQAAPDKAPEPVAPVAAAPAPAEISKTQTPLNPGTGKAAPVAKLKPKKHSANPAAKKKAILGCIGAFGGILLIFLILSFVFIGQSDGASNPIANMLNVSYGPFINGLITFIHIIFVVIALLAFVLTMIGIFKTLTAKRDDKEEKKRGLKAALIFGIVLIFTLIIWGFTWAYLDEKRVVVGTESQEPITTDPVETLQLSAPIEVKFDASNVEYNKSKYKIVSHSWDFGDGSTGSSQIDSHIYEEKGEFKVELKITLEDKSTGELIDGGIFTKTVSITNQALAAIFSADPQSGEAPLEVHFDASDSVDPDGNIDSYNWDLNGDGQYDDGTGEIIEHKFEKVGKYTVALQVISTTGEFDVSEKEIDVKKAEEPEPVITVIDEPDEFIKGVSYIFKADESSSPNGNIEEYFWDFGDGSDIEDTKSISHSFDTEGSFEVTLKVIDEEEKEAEITKIISIGAPEGSPKAKISTQPGLAEEQIILDGVVPFSVVFDASNTTDSDDNIVDYEWNFGDGSDNGYGDTISHLFTSEGTYTVTLTVTDSDGNIGIATQVVRAESQGIVADIKADQIDGSVPLTIAFDATGSTYQDGQIATYKWDFGDGTAEKIGSAQINHKYTAIGSFTAKVTVVGTDNTSATDTVIVTVREIALSACFKALFEEGPAPLETSFDPGCATGTVANYFWDFGDGSTSTQVKPIHVFEDAGEYRVTLEVSDTENTVDKHELFITVTE
jgi:PKD repeat protein